MKLWYRFAFSPSACPHVLDFLEQRSVPLKRGSISVVLLEDAPQNQEVLGFLCEHLFPLVYKEFTAQELDGAAWLNVRPVWNQFHPFQEDKTYHRPCPSCMTNQEQHGDLHLSSPVKRWKQPFLMLYDARSILVPARVRDILGQSGLRGFSFRPVYYRESPEPLPDVFQLCVDTILPPAAVAEAMRYKEQYVCPVCGTAYGVLSAKSPLSLQRDVLEHCGVDIAWSHEQYGASGFARKCLISQPFRRLLLKHSLADALYYDDVVQLV